jgi:hypothetical protein
MANAPTEFSWNRLENKQGFSTTGNNTATPFAAPATLPTNSLVQGAGAHTLDYYVRFTLSDGSTVMVNGDSLFKLESFSLADNQTLNIGSQTVGAGAGKATFDPLHLTFSQLALDPELLKLLTSGATLKEVDVLGYSQSQGQGQGQGGVSGQHLVEDYSFGLVGAKELATDDSGVTSLDLQYGSQEIQFYQQNTNGSFPSSPTSTQAWSTVTNSPTFSTNGTAQSTPATAPLTLPAAQVAPSSGALDYYVRFTLADGTVLTLNGAQYFGLSQFSFDDQQTLSIGSQSGGAGAGKATFNPLQLTFGQQGLDPQLLKLLGSGMTFKEVDVVGYKTNIATGAHQLVQDYSFGLVGASELATDNSGFTQLSLQYGSTDIHTFAVACYCRGTHILTQSGDVRVEDLKIGDDVATRAGAFRPIKWVGKRSYSGRFAAGQKHILPICFKAGSLADNVPRRDLWISPHHAMYLEGVLIEAKDLVNDVSIVQAEHVESVEYFHIELDTHDVIIAEGALSETFVDDDSRGMFHNAHEYSLLYPEQRHQHEVHYCAPRCDSGYEVEAARQCIEARAGLRSPENARPLALRGNVDRVTSDRIEGWAQNPDCPEIPICLDIYLGDRLIGQTLANRYREDLEQAGLGSGRHRFTFVVAPGDGILSEAIQVRRSLDGAKIASLPPAMRAHRRYAISAA